MLHEYEERLKVKYFLKWTAGSGKRMTLHLCNLP